MNFYILTISLLDSWLYPIVKPTWLYRILQKAIEIIGLFIVFYFYGIDMVAGCLVCHYFMVMDRLFYLIRDEEYIITKYEGKTGKDRPQWLIKWYFSGKWIFPYFSMHKFDVSVIVGYLIAWVITEYKLLTYLLRLCA